MNDRLTCITGSGLLGAAIGAALQNVSWTWWAGWFVAWGALMLLNHWHRRERNGGPTHA